MNKIYVGNLPFSINDSDLQNEFQKFGEIKDMALIRDRYSNQFKGFAFVTFATKESADAALSMDGVEFMGRTMKVSIAREPSERTGDRGGRRGGGHHGGGHKHNKDRW